jgi:hypothetical protein
MPAFGAVLSDGELQRTLDHIRTFCGDPAWPRGELNLPRALVTEKAYPEDEAVLSVTVSGGDQAGVGQELVYEKRFGPRSQIEIAVPVLVREAPVAGWRRGLGDVAIGVKHAVLHGLAAGRIFSVGGEVVFPTGKENEGLGGGVTVFEPFVAFGQLFGGDSFIQVHAGLELPANRDAAGDEAFWRVALGRSFAENRFGRTWSPMLEVLGVGELGDDRTADWDLLPQVQITLSRRQHIMVNAGLRLPVNNRTGRPTRVVAYLLWDWFDGGLLDGWR